MCFSLSGHALSLEKEEEKKKERGKPALPFCFFHSAEGAIVIR
jgi:hypothetical protein